MSTAGRSIIWRPGGKFGEWRSWLWAAEASVVMLRKLTRMPWLRTRVLASSRRGMMWPMPGIGRTATWGFLVSVSAIIMVLCLEEVVEDYWYVRRMRGG